MIESDHFCNVSFLVFPFIVSGKRRKLKRYIDECLFSFEFSRIIGKWDIFDTLEKSIEIRR